MSLATTILVGTLLVLSALALTTDHTVAPLPYQYGDLAPYIDARTVEVHYENHHKSYARNLNAALVKLLEAQPSLASMPFDSFLMSRYVVIDSKLRETIFNNAGGLLNHNLYWATMAPLNMPNRQAGPGQLLERALVSQYGSMAAFKREFLNAARGLFGSGWTFLTANRQGVVGITSFQGHEAPIMQGLFGLLVTDVWEHSYYLQYQDKRGDYLESWWSLINWAAVDANYVSALDFLTKKAPPPPPNFPPSRPQPPLNQQEDKTEL